MQRFDIPLLRDKTRESLSNATWDPKKLIFIHTGASLLLSLLLSLADYFLSREIGSTGGLGGMDRRNVLTTVQMVLLLAYTAALPFWTFGYVGTTLSLARREEVSPSSLLDGFRCWGAVLRLTMLEMTLVLMVGLVSVQVGSLLFYMTPWARPVLEQIVQQTPPPGEGPASLETMMLITENAPMLPLLLFVGLTALALGAPVYYRFRLARLFLMDDPGLGALRALIESFRRMRGNYGAMFRLDLHFWWFHVLNLLTVVLSFGDVLLAEAGVTLNWAPAPLVFSLAGSLCQIGLYWWRYNEVHVTYVHAFDELGQPPLYTE